MLFLHFESKEIATVEIRNIYISLAVTPMSAFCVSRYSFFNKFTTSSKLNDALKEVQLITKQSTSQQNIEIEHNTEERDRESLTTTDDEDIDEKEQALEIEREALYVLDSCLSKTKPADMKDMEDVLELMVPTLILWNLNMYLLYAGFTYLYIFCVMFIVIMFLVIWFKFSKNIGLITPLILPMTCLVLEFFAFAFMATLNLIFHQQSPVAALVIAPLILLSVISLLWKKKGQIHTD